MKKRIEYDEGTYIVVDVDGVYGDEEGSTGSQYEDTFSGTRTHI